MMIYMTSLLLILLSAADGYQILILADDMPSHGLVLGHLGNSLIQRGHQVTFVTSAAFNLSDFMEHENMTVETFENPDDIYTKREEWQHSLFASGIDHSDNHGDMVQEAVHDIDRDLGRKFYEDESLQKRLADTAFDFVVVDDGIAPYMAYPYIRHIPYAIYEVYCRTAPHRIPINPSVVRILPLYSPRRISGEMSFIERIMNLIAYVTEWKLSETYVHIPWKEALHYSSFTYSELYAAADLCLTSRDNLIDFIRPQMPNTISTAMLTLNPGKQLPADLEAVVNAARDGVVLVSFGSSVASVPSDVMQKMLTAFASLPYTFLMKSEGDFSQIPHNVHIRPWLPQNDILAHHRTRLFITHGGYSSLIETVYQAVPVIVFPRAYDHFMNAEIAKMKGLGVVLHLGRFTSDELVNTIQEVIHNGSYYVRIKELSDILYDIEKSEMSDPAFWIEHVIRYGSGHLTSQAYNLSWYQFLMLDILAFGVLLLILLIAATALLSYVLFTLASRMTK